MPKLKTHSGAKKRLKTAKWKRHNRGTAVTDKTNVKAVKKMLPYA